MKVLPFLKHIPELCQFLLERGRVVKRLADFGQSIECGHYLTVAALTLLELIRQFTG